MVFGSGTQSHNLTFPHSRTCTQTNFKVKKKIVNAALMDLNKEKKRIAGEDLTNCPSGAAADYDCEAHQDGHYCKEGDNEPFCCRKEGGRYRFVLLSKIGGQRDDCKSVKVMELTEAYEDAVAASDNLRDEIFGDEKCTCRADTEDLMDWTGSMCFITIEKRTAGQCLVILQKQALCNLYALASGTAGDRQTMLELNQYLMVLKNLISWTLKSYPPPLNAHVHDAP